MVHRRRIIRHLGRVLRANSGAIRFLVLAGGELMLFRDEVRRVSKMSLLRAESAKSLSHDTIHIDNVN
jgi:hypothetical protein